MKILVTLVVSCLLLTLIIPAIEAAIRRGNLRSKSRGVSPFRRNSISKSKGRRKVQSSFPRAFAKAKSRLRATRPSKSVQTAKKIQKQVLVEARARQRFLAKEKLKLNSKKRKSFATKKCRNKLKVVTKQENTVRFCDIHSLSLKVGLKKLIRR